MKHLKRTGIIAILIASLGLVTVPLAVHAEYPERAVEIMVPFNPGGGADTSQRTFNKYAEKIVGQRLIVVNKPGAGGTRGWAEFVNSKADGYGLAIETPPYSIIPALSNPKQTGYTLDQFTRICIYAVVPDVLVAKAGGKFNTLQDLIDYAKSNPKKVKAGNTGTLGADFMTTLLIENKAGVEFTQIPYTGGSQALQGVLSGTADVMVASALFAAAQKGEVVTLAIASEERDQSIPDAPTFKEQGLDIVAERYRLLAAPPGTPKEVVDYWAGVCEQVVANEDFQAEMKKLGQPPAYRGPAMASELVDSLTKEMQALVEKYNLAK